MDAPSHLTPIQWLENSEYGFKALSEAERNAILHFTLLWSLFENKVHGTHASAQKMLTRVSEWHQNGRLAEYDFSPALQYFRERYIVEGQPNSVFKGLKFRQNDKEDFVAATLKCANPEPEASLSALLLIIYRLRNNLFHGSKWAEKICDQLDNFTHANAVLMKALIIAK